MPCACCESGCFQAGIDLSAPERLRNDRYRLVLNDSSWRPPTTTNHALSFIHTAPLYLLVSEYPTLNLVEEHIYAIAEIIRHLNELKGTQSHDSYWDILQSVWPFISGRLLALLEAWILVSDACLGSDGSRYPRQILEGIDVEEMVIIMSIALSNILLPLSQEQQLGLLTPMPNFMASMFDLNVRLRCLDRRFHLPILWNNLASLAGSNPWIGQTFVAHATRAIGELGEEHLMGDLVGYLIDETSKPPSSLDIFAVECAFSLMRWGWYVSTDPLRRALLTQGAIRRIAVAIRRFAVLGSRGLLNWNDTYDVLNLMGNACEQLRDLALMDGYSWVVELVNARFLTDTLYIFRLGHGVDDDLMGPVKQSLLSFVRTMKTYTVYRSVLDRILTEMDEIKKKNLLEILPKDNELRVALEQLHSDALSLKSEMYLFTDGQYRLITLCASSECPLRERKYRKKIKYKRCSKCFSALYCSRTCQKMDWENHKEHCDSYLGPGQGYSHLPSLFDGVFAQHYLVKQIHSPQISATISTQLCQRGHAPRNRRYEPLVIVGDFREWPMKISMPTYAEEFKQICSHNADDEHCELRNQLKSSTELTRTRKFDSGMDSEMPSEDAGILTREHLREKRMAELIHDLSWRPPSTFAHAQGILYTAPHYLHACETPTFDTVEEQLHALVEVIAHLSGQKDANRGVYWTNFQRLWPIIAGRTLALLDVWVLGWMRDRCPIEDIRGIPEESWEFGDLSNKEQTSLLKMTPEWIPSMFRLKFYLLRLFQHRDLPIVQEMAFYIPKLWYSMSIMVIGNDWQAGEGGVDVLYRYFIYHAVNPQSEIDVSAITSGLHLLRPNFYLHTWAHSRKILGKGLILAIARAIVRMSSFVPNITSNDV
ncbi:hypothetical protein VNI00_004479 [Paramarasmius palmivorus]|uniref:MYND-type domain-containing protein n=1 Tax=Paramarasmius palmivorus TaxID=297713 RepID=A0AAW0DJW1_9AGAR